MQSQVILVTSCDASARTEGEEFEAGRCVCFNMGTAGGAHLVELPQILLLCLVDYSQDSGDGLANNTAAKNK